MTPQGIRLDYMLRERELRAKREAEAQADIERAAGLVFWGLVFAFALIGLGALAVTLWQGIVG